MAVVILKWFTVGELAVAGLMLVVAALIDNGLKRYRKYQAGMLAGEKLTEEERRTYASLSAKELLNNVRYRNDLLTFAFGLMLASLLNVFVWVNI